MKKQVDTLTIAFSGKTTHNIPLESVLKILTETRHMLRELDSKKTLDWSVGAVHFSSPLTFEIDAETEYLEYDDKVVDNYVQTMMHVSGLSPPPRRATAQVIARARRVASVLDDGVGRLWVGGKSRRDVEVYQVKSTNLVVEERAEYEDVTSLEGTLEVVSTHGGRKVAIWDRVTNDKTECKVSHAHFVQALEALKHNDSPRVLVHGLAQYKKGVPVVINVDDFDVLPSLDEATDPSFFQGINLTDGVDSVDYVRSMRDDG